MIDTLVWVLLFASIIYSLVRTVHALGRSYIQPEYDRERGLSLKAPEVPSIVASTSIVAPTLIVVSTPTDEELVHRLVH